MTFNVYVVQDAVSRQRSELSLSVSHAAARRSFGEAISQAHLSPRVQHDQLLFCVGSADFDGARPILSGCEAELVCDGFEAATDLEEVTSYFGASV